MQIQRILSTSLVLLAAGPLAPAQVTQAWLDRFDGTGDADFASDITHDWAGNAYVVGATRVPKPPNVLVPQLLVLKYDVQGNRAWTRTFAGATGSAFGDRVAMAPDGDVLVAGSVDGGLDWVLLRYDAAGNELWHRVFITGSSYLNGPSALVVDAQGNAYVAGNLPGSAADPTAVTLKYDPSGNLLWQHTFEPAGQSATVNALALDQGGNVLSAGSTVVPGLSGEVGLRKLDANGNLLWARTFGHFEPFAYDQAEDVGVDPDGRVFLACTVGSNTSFGSDIVVLAYEPDGVKLWDRKFDGTASKSDWPVRIAVDEQSQVHVVGNTHLGGTDYDTVTLKYSVAGGLLWSRQYGGQAFDSDRARDLRLDPAGRVYVVGRVYTLTNAGGYFVVRYDAEGTLDWSAIYDGPLGGFSEAEAVTVDAAGSVWVTGESDGLTTDRDIATLCYRDRQHTVYCTAKTNALGCTPKIAGLGSPSATQGSGFVVTGTAVRNRKAGLMLYGTSGRAAAPFQGGLLCIATPLRRTVGVSSNGHAAPINDCSGVYQLDMNAFAAGALGGNPLPALSQPGTVVTAQWWGRDPGFPFPTNTTLTNGLEYTVAP